MSVAFRALFIQNLRCCVQTNALHSYLKKQARFRRVEWSKTTSCHLSCFLWPCVLFLEFSRSVLGSKNWNSLHDVCGLLLLLHLVSKMSIDGEPCPAALPSFSRNFAISIFKNSACSCLCLRRSEFFFKASGCEILSMNFRALCSQTVAGQSWRLR